MLLNAEKTVIMNTSLSQKFRYNSDILVDNVTLTPVNNTKFLGITIDNKLNFNAHIDFLVSKCNSRIFVMRKLKTIGLNRAGLKT